MASRDTRKDSAKADSAAPDLTSDLEYLDRLNRLRRKAKDLRDNGLEALTGERDETDWDPTRSPMTKILLRRAKHLAWDLGRKLETLADNFDDLPTIALAPGDSGGASVAHLFPTDSPTDRHSVPVLLAASYLRARLDELTGPGGKDEQASLGKDFFHCLYRIIRELLTIEFPESVFGGARASSGAGTISMFVTSECARALGYLASIVEDTGHFLSEIAKVSDYVSLIELNTDRAALPIDTPIPDDWCVTELSRVGESIRSLARSKSARCLLRLDRLELQPRTATCRTLLQLVTDMAEHLVRDSVEPVRNAIKEIDALRAAEAKESDKARARSYDLSETAHRVARKILKDIEETHLATIIAAADDRSFSHASVWLNAASVQLARAGRDVNSLLGPVHAFADNHLHKAVFDAESTNMRAGLQDMAFAAISSGASRTKDWGRDIYIRAFDILSRNLDEEGCLPLGKPFYVTDGGVEKHAINAHSLSALAHFAQKVPRRIDATLVERMLRFFETEASAPHNGKGLGWRRKGVGGAARLSPWVTAISVISLNRIVVMLDRKINDCLAEHFTVATSRDLADGPPIDDLMCSDIGLASVAWKSVQRERRTVTHDLELLRAHLVSRRPQVPPPNQRLRSLILYGPPGTGKTTLAEALARSCGAPLVKITPSDFVIHGAEGLERRAKSVMRALSMFTRVVILFDEFDAVIHDRVETEHGPRGMFEFLTSSMLPRLSDLNRASEENSFVYVLATNYIERLDAAATRPGRFELKRGVYPSDPASRICRIVSQLEQWRRHKNNAARLTDGWQFRLLEVVANTAGVPMAQLSKKGWYKRPKGEEPPMAGTAWEYICIGGEAPVWPMPADVGRDTSVEGQVYKNSLEIDQDAEMSLVEDWNRCLLETVSDRGPTPLRDWKAIVESLKEVKVGRYLEKWAAETATLRARRNAGRQYLKDEPDD